MSDASAPRALRLLVLAAALALGWVILGAASARADDSPLGNPPAAGQASVSSARPTHVKVVVPVAKLMAEKIKPATRTGVSKSQSADKPLVAEVKRVAKPVVRQVVESVAKPAVKPAVAVVKPVAKPAVNLVVAVKRVVRPVVEPVVAVVKPVVAVKRVVRPVVEPVVAVVKPVVAVKRVVRPVVEPVVAVVKPVVAVKRVVRPVVAVVKPVAIPVMKQLVASSRATPTTHQSLARRTFFAMAPDSGISRQVYAFDAASQALLPVETSSRFPRASRGPLVMPATVPCSVTGSGFTQGAGSGGNGPAFSDRSAGPITDTSLLLRTLSHGSWVLPEPLSYDPGSSPD